MAGSMSPQDLKALLDSQTLYAVIDVRDWGEFSLGQIPGTNCIPRGSLEKYISVLVPKTDIQTVLYCDTGQRSTRAALSLETMGYTNVSVLDSGLTAWTALAMRPCMAGVYGAKSMASVSRSKRTSPR